MSLEMEDWRLTCRHYYIMNSHTEKRFLNLTHVRVRKRCSIKAITMADSHFMRAGKNFPINICKGSLFCVQLIDGK